MKLHILGLPHTVTHDRFSHDAFTGKVQRFSPMMREAGYEVVHYGVEGAESGASEQVDVLSYEEWKMLGGLEPSDKQYGNQDVRHPAYVAFNFNLVAQLNERVSKQDIICLPFGYGHDAALAKVPAGIKVENGIGYKSTSQLWNFRIYESYAWLHWHLGRADRSGSDYEWVVPNYYNPNDWKLGEGRGEYLLYFGRICQDKGLDIVYEIAKARPDLKVIMCGQGEPERWFGLPNLEYLKPIHGAGRDKLLGNATAVLMPSRYVEPFGSVAIEAMFCGTPVIGSDFGAYTETIQHGFNGYRCHTLKDWLRAIDDVRCGNLAYPGAEIRLNAIGKYSYTVVGQMYDRIYRQLDELWQDGWYTK